MIYVNDIVIITLKRTQIDSIKASLKEHFEIKDLGPISHFLGLKIKRERTTRTLSIT